MRPRPPEEGEVAKQGYLLSETARPEFNKNYLGDVAYGGQGKDFTAYRQAQALDAIRQGITEDEGDIDVRAALRKQLLSRASSYDPAQRRDMYEADSERGLTRALSAARRQLAASGASGSSRGLASMGDIVNQSLRDRTKGMQDLELQDIQALQGMAGVGGQITQQSLMERGFTLEQAKAIANVLQGQANAEQQSILSTREQPGPSDFEKGLGYVLQGAGAAAPFFTGGAANPATINLLLGGLKQGG